MGLCVREHEEGEEVRGEGRGNWKGKSDNTTGPEIGKTDHPELKAPDHMF